MKKLKDIPIENQGGDCFKVAAETVMKDPSLKLVHAIVSGQGALDGIQYTHAFALDEKRDIVIDNTQKNPELRELPVALYWYIGKIKKYKEYTPVEMHKMLLKHKTWGPWDRMFDEVLEESLENMASKIPEDSMLDVDNIKIYDGAGYSRYEYFGDCRNTVDVDEMWDATQMAGWINNRCSVIDIDQVKDKLYSGDRKIPKVLATSIEKLDKRGQLHDPGEIVCGIDDKEKIMFIYLSSKDMHYFFDCVR